MYVIVLTEYLYPSLLNKMKVVVVIVIVEDIIMKITTQIKYNR